MEQYKVNFSSTTTFTRLNKETNGLQSVLRCFAGNIDVESELGFGKCQKAIHDLANEAVKQYNDTGDFLYHIFTNIDTEKFNIVDANLTYANERSYELKGTKFVDKSLLGPYAPKPTYEEEIDNQIMLLNGGDKLSHLSTEEKVEILKAVTGKNPVTQNPPPKKLQ